MEVGDGGTIALYGCFRANDTSSIVSGIFVDDTYLESEIKSIDGGTISLISVSEQECDTAPSTSPTDSPTISSPPTVTPPNGGGRGRGGEYMLIFMTATVINFIRFIFGPAPCG